MTVKATDADDPTTQNGMIGYKLLNGTDLFNINNNGLQLETLGHKSYLSIYLSILINKQIVLQFKVTFILF